MTLQAGYPSRLQSAAGTSKLKARDGDRGARLPGRCNMKGQCGKKNVFSPDLPCAVDEVDAEEPTEKVRQRLTQVCGQDFADGPVCCEAEQVEALATNLDQAEPLISSCPACRNNFRKFFCSFTCSPNQSQFLDVSSTQKTDGKHGPAVKSVEYWVGDRYRQGFYDSCKDVKFGASNGFVMDLLGGGAKDPDAFLKYLGDEKPLVGSPFQINFPHPPTQPQSIDEGVTTFNSSYAPIPFDPAVRSCGDSDLLSRCACTDCPSVCTDLPYVAPPIHGPTCAVGPFRCFTVFVFAVYLLGVLASLAGYKITSRAKSTKKRVGIRHRSSGISISSEAGFEQVRLATEDGTEDQDSDLASRSRAASSDEISSAAADTVGPRTGASLLNFAGEGSLNALRSVQPRSYAINSFLSSAFYKVGLRCAKSPFATFAIALVFVAIANLGWRNFQVETDPVRLWVAPNSPSKLRKEFFDENFGPFYRTEQAFLIDESAENYTRAYAQAHDVPVTNVSAVLNWERLEWWAQVEEAIRELQTDGDDPVKFEDICFAPQGEGGPCVVQSIMGYFQDDLDGAGVNGDNWQRKLNACAQSPAECLPAFSQPLKPNIILGGIPLGSEAAEARAVVTTWVVQNSLNPEKVRRAQAWERKLEAFLLDLAGVRTPAERHPLALKRETLGVRLIISTESSLEEEIADSSNTDTGIVILSYLIMLLYAASTLGGGGPKASATASHRAPAPPGNSVQTGFAPRLRALFTRRASRGPIHLDDEPNDYAAEEGYGLRQRIFDRLFVRSKFSLGLFGIVIVLVAVSSAVGIFSAMGVKVTLVIAEVIPFLVLAVGVDNVFLLSHEMDRQNSLASTSNPYYTGTLGRNTGGIARQQVDGSGYDEYDDYEDEVHAIDEAPAQAYHLPSTERAARALSRTGPSILLSAAIQITAFLLGALVPMPAVRNFALYAAGSMAIAALLHCTVFVAALALDADRVESGRLDCLPCVRPRRQQGPAVANLGVGTSRVITEGWLARIMRESYAPALMRKHVKRAVVVGAAGLFSLALVLSRRVEMGLDQRLALPPGSYLRSYFDAIDTWLEVGPPVYFVAENVDTRQRSGQQALCGRFTTCDPFSVANVLEGERKRPESSFIAEPAASWLDDFLEWLNPVLESCCRVKIKDPSTFCTARDSEFDCQPCFLDRQPPWNITMEGLPEGPEFMMYLRQWLKSPTNEECPLGGQAAYSTALSIKKASALSARSPSPSEEDASLEVFASHFRTFHTPLRSQADFIDALQAAERISNELSGRHGAQVFAYSLFYVFFDQYLHLYSLAARTLGGAALSIFVITTIFLGSWRTALVVTACVASAVTGVFGAMGIWGISFNALTLVNLIVCAAICVEFCAHVARAFMRAAGGLPRSHPLSQKERDERARTALGDVGGPVLSGIMSTKLIGISVLWFTRSELLKLYYAKMWLSVIILGAIHGLVILPVLLSFQGSRGYSSAEMESEVRKRLLRAQESTEYRPFTADDRYDSDEDN